MNKRTRGLAVLGLVIIGLGVAGFVMRARALAPIVPGPLTHATAAQVGQVALNLVRQDFDVRSGSPQVVLTRSIVRADLPKLNLPSLPQSTVEEPPLMLVIIHGDFGRANLPSIVTGPTDESFKYIGYVFDLWAGSPTLTMASPNGGEFRTVLGDPTLPIVDTPLPLPTLDPSAALPHYGAVAPTVAAPGQP